MLGKEQAREVKKQIIEQIKSTFPDDKKNDAIQQIEEMNDEEFESFLIQNNLVKSSAGNSTNTSASQGKCIFCSIAQGDIPSTKVAENKDAVAVLEINPVSKGHVIIIPSKHVSKADEIPQTVFSLAKQLAKKLKTKLKPKDVKIENSNFMGHEVVNVFPVYNNESLKSEKTPVKLEELEALKKILEEKLKAEKKPRAKKVRLSGEKIWLPKRIP